jgi:xylan 1,4-beta-xylosidase
MTVYRLSLFLCCAISVYAQQKIELHVNASKTGGLLTPVWNYFGYDEPNYTYAPNGRKLTEELAASSASPVHIRVHNLLTSGDGTASLKWGSTNAYTEDNAGHPVYNWSIVDRIFDTWIQAGVKPFVEIGFMPEALSTHPAPYRHNFPQGTVFTGWSYPPKDYSKWSQLVYRWVKHCAERYGAKEAATWDWEVWNEPDIAYWHGTPDEYDKLYDITAAAIKRALPSARVGGPATTGPANPKAAAFLKQFLDHCAAARSPLDFISFHAKGRPEVVNGHVRMGLGQELKDVSAGFSIVRASKFRDLPIVLSEADPEGCAACSARTNPRNTYRNGTLYAAYEAAAMKGILELAAQSAVNLRGILTWAFEFEHQPYFDGFRALATNGIDKPVLNFFRMAGLLSGDIIPVERNALASRSANRLTVLTWNYEEDDVPGPPAKVVLNISGLPVEARRVLLRHYRIDEAHSNAYAVWKQMASPQSPSADQIEALQRAGQLGLLGSPRWIDAAAPLHFDLPRGSVSLIELSW